MREAQHVAIRLSQGWADGAPAIGFYVLGHDGREVAKTSTFISGDAVVQEVDLEQSDEPYKLIVCTFNAGIKADFKVSVYSTSGNFDLKPAA